MKKRIWTAWDIDYATGEGSTLCIFLGYATDEDDLKALFTEHFGEYRAKGMEYKEGLPDEKLFPYIPQAYLDMATKLHNGEPTNALVGRPWSFSYVGKFHDNYS